MKKPTRFELVTKFFPELGEPGAKADKEASIAYSALACEVLLADQLKYFDRGFQTFGPGVLCVRLHSSAQDCEYLPLADLVSDHAMATRCNDESLIDALAGVIQKVESANFEKCGLILLIDNSTMQLCPLDREFPARSIQAMLEEFST